MTQRDRDEMTLGAVGNHRDRIVMKARPKQINRSAFFAYLESAVRMSIRVLVAGMLPKNTSHHGGFILVGDKELERNRFQCTGVGDLVPHLRELDVPRRKRTDKNPGLERVQDHAVLKTGDLGIVNP